MYMNDISLYTFSQIYNIAVKVVAVFINVAIIFPIQIRELKLARIERKYLRTAITLLTINLFAIALLFIAIGLFYIRTHLNWDERTYFTVSNFVTSIYLLYSFAWIVLYKNYFIKRYGR